MDSIPGTALDAEDLMSFNLAAMLRESASAHPDKAVLGGPTGKILKTELRAA